jgi:FkbM family methyltransferase
MIEEDFLLPLYEPLLNGPRRVAVDVGANVGDWTHWLSQRFDHVIAVEPDPRAVAVLRPCLPRNATLLQAACGNSGGDVDFFVRDNPLQSSLLPEHPIGGGDQRDVSVVEVVKRPCLSLDQILTAARLLTGHAEIDFVKLDIEGAEHLALQSATPELFRNTRWLIEIHDNRVPVGLAVQRLGYETLRVVRHPAPNAHPEHLWILANESR